MVLLQLLLHKNICSATFQGLPKALRNRKERKLKGNARSLSWIKSREDFKILFVVVVLSWDECNFFTHFNCNLNSRIAFPTASASRQKHHVDNSLLSFPTSNLFRQDIYAANLCEINQVSRRIMYRKMLAKVFKSFVKKLPTKIAFHSGKIKLFITSHFHPNKLVLFVGRQLFVELEVVHLLSSRCVWWSCVVMRVRSQMGAHMRRGYMTHWVRRIQICRTSPIAVS